MKTNIEADELISILRAKILASIFEGKNGDANTFSYKYGSIENHDEVIQIPMDVSRNIP